jgi:hypothetical protein
MITNKDIYRCYSVSLMQFMNTHDVRYLLIAIDVVTKKKFWAYEKTDNFNMLLQQWEKNNPKK